MSQSQVRMTPPIKEKFGREKAVKDDLGPIRTPEKGKSYRASEKLEQSPRKSNPKSSVPKPKYKFMKMIPKFANSKNIETNVEDIVIQLDDNELYNCLFEIDAGNIGPILDTTRGFYRKKLIRHLQGEEIEKNGEENPTKVAGNGFTDSDEEQSGTTSVTTNDSRASRSSKGSKPKDASNAKKIEPPRPEVPAEKKQSIVEEKAETISIKRNEKVEVKTTARKRKLEAMQFMDKIDAQPIVESNSSKRAKFASFTKYAINTGVGLATAAATYILGFGTLGVYRYMTGNENAIADGGVEDIIKETASNL